MKKIIYLLVAMVGMVLSLNAQIPTNGLVANYPFNGNANDESGNGNDGTVNGATLTTDRFGNANNAYSFDGTSNFIEILHSTNLNFGTSPITISVWVNLSIANSSYFITKERTTAPDGSQLRIEVATNPLRVGYLEGVNNDGMPAAPYTTQLELNIWYNVILIKNGASYKIYLNGQPTDSVQAAQALDQTNNINNITLGAESAATGAGKLQFFSGKMDDVRFYNRALATDEIQALYQEGGWSSLDQGLVASYPFNGNANDESGNGNIGTVNGATLTSDRFGNANCAYNFVNNSSITTNFPGVLGNADRTISFWVKILPSETGGHALIYGGTGATEYGGNFTPGVFVNETGSDLDTCAWMDIGNSAATYSLVNTNFSDWHHYVYTFSTLNGTSLDGVKIYQDGIPLSNLKWTYGFTSYTLNTIANKLFTIGNDEFSGSIDDIKVYNRVLDNSEIVALYNEPAPLTDIDGNTYNTVTIGTQTWMKENLKTTKYRNGDAIPNVTDNAAWAGLTTGAYSWVNNDINNKDIYGAMYNFYAVTDSRNICPLGWHVSTDEDFKILEVSLGMTQSEADAEGDRGSDQGTQMKSNSGWNAGENGTNISGFSILPSGSRYNADGLFYAQLVNAHFWMATESGSGTAWDRIILNNKGAINRVPSASKANGMVVRCLKDTEKSIVITDFAVNEGQTLEVLITVNDLSAVDNVISYQFDVIYDNTVLTYTGNSIVGTLADGGTIDVNTAIAGKLSIGYINTTPIIGAGTILKLQFNTLVADTTILTISNAYLNSDSIESLTNAIVIVKDVTPPIAAITYNDTDVRYADVLTITATISEPMLASNAVKLSLSGAANVADADMTRQSETVYTYTYSVPKADGIVTVELGNGTDLWSNAVVSAPASGSTFTIVKMVYGDVDDNGLILAYDAALTLQRSVGLDPLPAVDPIPWENWRDSTANVDATVGVTANDAAMILQFSIGKISSFTAQSKKFTGAGIADVTVGVENNDIVFYSSGDLLGLNISAVNTNQILGTPTVTAANFLSAVNISGTTYKVGICTANSPSDGIALLKIPFTKSGSVSFDMIVNTVTKTVTVDLVTGIIEFSDGNISIYPNPVRDNLKISGLNAPTTARIYSINGKLLLTEKMNSSNGEINVSNFPAGMYVIRLQAEKEIAVKRFAVE